MRDFEASLAGILGPGGQAPLAVALVAAVAAKAMTGAFGNVGGLLGGGQQMAPAPFRQPHAEPQGATGLLGGLGGLLHAFEEAGLGPVIGSWVGPGPNDPVSAEQVRQAMGADLVRRVAEKTGLPEPDVASRLARELPGAIDRLTPHGRLPGHEEASALLHGHAP